MYLTGACLPIQTYGNISRHQSTSIRKLMHNKCCYFNLGHVIGKSATVEGITELLVELDTLRRRSRGQAAAAS